MSLCFTDEETEVAKWYFQGLRTSEAQTASDWQTPKSRILSGDPVLVLWQRPPAPEISCAVLRWGSPQPSG